jgi:Ca-activated chloride channel homolog
MKMRELLIIIIIASSLSSFSQGERKHIRSGNKEFEKENFEDSEVDYRKALEKKSESYDATFNLGDALYKQEKYDEALKQFQLLASKEQDKEKLGQLYHNLGNSLLQSQKLEESIEAYKEALRNNPSDMETKYNLAYAQSKLQEQQEQEQQQDQDQDQENEDQQEKEDQEQQKQDQQDQEQQQQEQDQQQQQQEQQENQISQEDAQRMLEALQQDEKDLLEKLKKQKAKAQRFVIEKDW